MLFGAQGTFWLWILAVISIWWTAKPAMIRISNRSPTEVALDGVGATAKTLTRWVKLEGVEVALDNRLLARPGGMTPVLLLIDPEDSAAQWWAETRRLADASLAAVASGDGDAASARAEARAALQNRYVDLTRGEGLDQLLPAPGHVVLVQDEHTLGLQELPPSENEGGTLIDDFEREVDRFGELVRKRVRLDVTLEGVLTDTPRVIMDRVALELDVHLSPWLIQAGREPNDLESYVFGVAAILVIFLATGLFGASRVRVTPPEDEDEDVTPPT